MKNKGQRGVQKSISNKEKMEEYIQKYSRNVMSICNVYDWINNYRKDGWMV